MSPIVDDLELAIDRGGAIQFHRARIPPGDEPFQGYVHQVSSGLAVVQLLSDRLDLDGYDVFRIADITQFELEYPQRRCLPLLLSRA